MKTVVPTLCLTCFGAPQIARGQEQASPLLSGKALALFLYLAVTRWPQSRDGLADLLWSELSNQQARNNLRYLLSDLRPVVGDYLVITPQSIGFNRQAPYWLDVEVLQTTLTAQPSTVTIPVLQAALDLYQGEFLAGFSVRNAPVFEEWVTSQREELHTLMLQGLYALAERYQQRGDFYTGLATTQRLLNWEPWHEAGHRLQMQLLADSGQRAAALAQYALCRHILADELGVAPEAATTALYEQLRSGKHDKVTNDKATNDKATQDYSVTPSPLHPPAPIPLHHVPHLPHNLPGQLTPFFGREQEIADLYVQLHKDDHRLITLVGEGGSVRHAWR